MELFNLGIYDGSAHRKYYKNLFLGLLLLVCQFAANAQSQFTTNGVAVSIDFEDFRGTGLSSGVSTANSLDSDDWAIDFDDDGGLDAAFGSDNTAGNFVGGVDTNDGDDTGGTVYAFQNASGNYMLGISMVRNNGADESNAAILRIQNNSGGTLTDVVVSADIFYLRQNNGFTTMSFSYSTNNNTYVGEQTAFTSNTNNNAWSATTDGTFNTTITGISVSDGDYIYLKWIWEPRNNANNPGAVGIDDLSLTPTIVTAADESSLTLDSDGSATLASTVTASTGQSVLGFTIADDALGAGDAFDFTFSGLTINAGGSDGVDDWSDVIAGVQLSDGSNTATASSISSTSIVFTGLGTSSGQIGFIGDGASKSYTVNVWLNTSISESIDNDFLQFTLTASDFDYSGVTSELDASASITTSSSNNQLTVTADRWNFQNTPTSVGTEVDFSLTLATTDINGNVDVDNSSANFTLAEAAGATGTLSSGSGLTQTVTSGVYTYSDLNYSVSETFSIDLTSASFSSINSGDIVAALSFRSAGSNTWATASNWEFFSSGVWTNAGGLGLVPDETDGPIAILSGHTVTVSAGRTADQISIESGGQLTLDAALTIADASGEFDLIVEGGGILTVNTLPAFNSGATASIEAGGEINSDDGNFEDDLAGSGSTNYFYNTDGFFDYAGNNNSFGGDTYFPNASSTDYPIVFLNGGFSNKSATFNGLVGNETGGNITFSNGTIDFRNGFAGGSQFTINANITLSISGNNVFLQGTGEVDFSAETVTYTSGQTVQLQASKPTTDGGFTFSSGSVLDLQSFEFNDAADDNFTLTINNGATLISSAASGFSGNVTTANQNYGSGVNYTLDGASAQTANFGSLGTGVNSAGDLTIDNSNGVTLNSALSLSGDLTLTNGSLTTSGTTLSLASASSISGASSSKYIIGPLSRAAFTGSQAFPIGTSTFYRPPTINPGASSSVSAEYVRSNPTTDISATLDTDGTTTAGSINENGYWTLTFGNTNTAEITLTFDETDDVITASSNLVIAKYDNSASEWVAYEASGFTTSSVTAFVTIDDVNDIYFTVGATSSSLLPIELKSFEATWEEGSVKLDWVTATEKNNDYFEVIRSPDAHHWEVLTMISGAGNSNQDINYQWVDEQPFERDNYYRLRQVDFDGTEEQHKIVWINNQALYPSKLIVYGNPLINATLDFEFVHVDRSTPVIVGLMDVGGRKVKSISIAEPGRHSIELRGVPTGTYLLRAQVGDQWFFKRFFKQ